MKYLIILHLTFIVVVQLLSHVQLFASPWTVACQTSLSFTVSQFVQTHVHWVSDATQPFHPLLSPSPLALNLSQHQGLFQWVTSSHLVAKVLELQLQHQSFQEYYGWFPQDWLLSPCWLSRVFFSTTVWNHYVFGAQPFLWSNSLIGTWLLEKP